jgi:hypothetical protein
MNAPFTRAARRRVLALLCGSLAVAVALPAVAYEPVVHEFIPPDDREDLNLSVTTTDGDLPAAIDPPSGVVRAPDTTRAPAADEPAYGEASAPSAPDPVFKADRDTRRPGTIRYQDPFTPAITPYKRLRAYDSVTPEGTLRVRDTALSRVPLGGELRPGEDQFYGDLTVDFDAGPSVLIPSVGPGARVLRQHTTPPDASVEIWRDGAENWYARALGSVKGRVRLVVQLAIARRAFGGALDMPTRAALPPVPALSSRLSRDVERVSKVIGVSRATPKAETVQKLVGYFRAFAASEQPPHEQDDIYLDLALSQKGVCRHRAYAFLVTALGLGIPSRMVVNEAHAWVEVRSADQWQRIDLGGAPAEIQEQVASGRPEYVAPGDAFPWPASSDAGSGRQAAMRGRRERSSEGADVSSASASGDPRTSPSEGELTGSTSSRGPSTPDREPGPESAEDERAATSIPRAAPGPRATIVVQSGEVQVRRGSAVAISGVVTTPRGAPCPFARLDVALRSASRPPTPLGVLGAGDDGRFAGEIVVPLGFPVGEYDVLVTTPPSEACGAGSSDPH